MASSLRPNFFCLIISTHVFLLSVRPQETFSFFYRPTERRETWVEVIDRKKKTHDNSQGGGDN